MAMPRSGETHRPLSEINVTPFVDVMLVLLVIFMVTAPMMLQGVDVDLPETTTQPLRVKDEPLVLTVNGVLDLQGTPGDPVIFTSIKDDSAGGDTNLDDGETEPAPGDWYYVSYGNTRNTIHDAVFRYAGLLEGREICII